MQVDLFDFDLPQDRIALRPAVPKEAARLLVVRQNDLTDRRIGDIPLILSEGDVLVVNDTKVLKAQLKGRRRARDIGGADASIDLTLHKQVGDDTWRAFARPAKRLRPEDHIEFASNLSAIVAASLGSGEVELQFPLSGSKLAAAIETVGSTPIPPYIASRRSVDAQDNADYQTVYAAYTGSVAAPTAGLHFSKEQMEALENKGVQIETVTLHVGAGTFLPVKAEDTSGHKMHKEWGTIDVATAARLRQAKREGRRIVSVGTTSLRLLESAVDENGEIAEFEGDTDIFITPGFKFQAVDLLLTNFHLPRSTLFMLVCAFSGREKMLNAYRHAIQERYRFYSYGDACLLYPEASP